MADYIAAGANVSACGTYRYSLYREWRGTHDPKNWEWFDRDYGEPKSCVFVMLNPSTADGQTDDPTIRRCVGFAKAMNYERIDVLNLFAFRATNPKQLLTLNHSDNPVGVHNQRYFNEVIPHAGIVIAAWGAHGSHIGQDETVLGWIEERTNLPVQCLGITKEGHPRHPLYLPSTARPMPFSGAAKSLMRLAS